MNIEIKLDADCPETKILITTKEMTAEISSLIKRMSEDNKQLLAGFQNDILELLKLEDLIRIYSEAGKIYAVTNKGTYSLRLRLYELEDRLIGSSFVRISNSEIINLQKVKNFDLSLTGTICVTLTNQTVTYVSRRYVSKIKKILGI